MSEIYDEFRSTVRRFAGRKVKPHAAAIDRDALPPEEAFEAARALGLQAFPSQEFGGSDGDLMLQVIASEELARVCATTSLTIASSWLFSIVVRHGSDELKKLVPGAASGEKKRVWWRPSLKQALI